MAKYISFPHVEGVASRQAHANLPPGTYERELGKEGFYGPATHSLELFRYGMFFAGFCTVAQLSFWGNYLPRVYPVHLRGTGEGFAANVGGRMLGTSAAYITTHLQVAMPGTSPAVKLAYAAAAVALFVYLLGFTLTFFLPEPPKSLAD